MERKGRKKQRSQEAGSRRSSTKNGKLVMKLGARTDVSRVPLVLEGQTKQNGKPLRRETRIK